MRSETVLVTGGAGFIGSHFLLSSVARQPHRLFVNVDCLSYASNPATLRSLAHCPNYRFERADIADAQALDQVFAKYEPTLVVHFAAETHVDRSIADPPVFVRANVVGTLNLLEAFQRHAPVSTDRLFLHVSTDEVYGSLGPSGLFTEQTPYNPSSPYSASKAASDHLVSAYARTYGLPVKITHCSNNYGPHQFPEKLIPLTILNALARRPLTLHGDGRNVRDWLYVTDHCRAIWAVIERGRIGGTYNIGGSCERTNRQVVEQVCHLVAEGLGATPGELLQLITLVDDRPGNDYRYAIDPTLVTADTGWEPHFSFEQGLARTVGWYLRNHTQYGIDLERRVG